MFKNLNCKKGYLVACSGGPDSMALLDMARKELKHIEVAHVNHHKRDTAKRDENIVRRYCKKYNLKFHLLNLKPENCKGNFQAFARDERYKFFGKICEKNNLEAVLVAHHKDDLIETYLMQKEKKLNVNYYGLRDNLFLMYVHVYRPLLNLTKKQILDYCKENNIEYGIDESNLTNAYTRNRIRHDVVDKMSDKQKDKLIVEIDKKNNQKLLDISEAMMYMNEEGLYDIDYFVKIPHIKTIIRVFFTNKSDKYIDEMIRQIKSSKNCHFVDQVFHIVKEYDKVHMFMQPTTYSYKFKSMDDLKSKKYEYFKIAKKGKGEEALTLSKKDFPITIKTANSKDSIKMTFGTKKLNRFFIDKKISTYDRMKWPVVLNAKGEVIMVPGLGCDVNHYSIKPNIYVIKL